ncbi:MAG: tetratricopeptide repeat protein, partial [Bacteroidota bacterium]
VCYQNASNYKDRMLPDAFRYVTKYKGLTGSDGEYNSEMTCITCHNPHQSVEITGSEHYNKKCASCHQTQVCTAPPGDLAAQNNNCVHCHMPPSSSTDIPHVTITDHNIRADNIRGMQRAGTSDPNPAFLGLEILTKPSGSPLELAKGYLALYDKYLPDPMLLDSVAFYLNKATGSDAELLKTRAHWLFNVGDMDALQHLAQSLAPDASIDAWSAYRIGEAYFQDREYEVAKQYYLIATEGLPLHLEFQEKLATTQMQTGEVKQAEERFRWILSENPKRPLTLCNLGYLKVRQRRFVEGEAFYDQALDLDPDYVQALLNKAAVRFQRNDAATGKVLLRRILAIDPNHPEAKPILEQFQ